MTFKVERDALFVLNTPMKKCLCLFFLSFAGLDLASAESVVDRLLASYDPVQSVQVEIRRDTAGAAGESRRLSRVYFRRPDQLNVESVTPPRRRIVADGTNFFSYIENDPKGFSRRISELDENWTISLRQVPGTAMDQLLRLRGESEEALPGTEAYPTRVVIKRDKRSIILNLDATGRLARIEFFADAAQTSLAARYDYENFQEPVPGVWFATLQKAVLRQDRDETTETTRLSNLQVNQPIPDPLFQHDTFFPNIVFTDNLDDIYGK